MKFIFFMGIVFTILSSCTRNPLGEAVTQPILNLGFTLSHQCTTTVPEYSPFSCALQTSEPLTDLVWRIEPENTCSWVNLDTATGVISGTTTNANILGCQIVVTARNDKRRSLPIVILMMVGNATPTLAISNPPSILEDAASSMIRSDTDVQSNEEIFGGSYTLDNAGATVPRCADNSSLLQINSTTGAVTYQPSLNFNGNCFVRVIYDDGGGWANSTVAAEFEVTVTPVNDAPVITPIAAQFMNESTTLNLAVQVDDVDHALNCSSLTYTSNNTVLVPAVGAISFSGTVPNCVAQITPTPLLNGLVDLTFSITDGALSDSKTFNLNIVPVNDPPVLSAIGNQTTTEDTPVVVPFTITDPDNVLICSSANLSLTSSNATLLPVANAVYGGAVPNCTVTLTPVADQSGVSNITLTVNDNGVPNLQDTRSFTFTVTAVNDAPVLSAISNQTSTEDNAITVNFTITDVDNTLNCGTSLTATSSDGVLLPVGNIVFSGTAPNCTAVLTPALDQSGVSNVGFTLTDGALTSVQNFTATYTAVNDAPVLSAITNQTTTEDVPVVVNFTITDVDNTLNCGTSLTATSSDGVLLPVGNIVFSGTAPNCAMTLSPVLNQSGTSNISLQVSDGTLTDIENFVFTVNNVNDAPVLSAISNQTSTEDNAITVNFTITDVDNTLNCGTSLTATSSDGVLLPVGNIVFSGVAPNCTAVLTPALNQNGVSNIGLTLTDGTLTSVQNFTATYTPVNDAPVISAIADQFTSESTPVNVNFTITDVDNALNCGTSLSATSSDTALLPVGNIVFSGTAPNCTATLSPTVLVNGTTTVQFTLTDGVLTAVESFDLTVAPVNDPPVLSAIGNQTTTEDTPVVVPFTITDPDNVLICSSANLSLTSSNATLLPVANAVYGGAVPNCTVTLTPVADQSGVSNITLTVNDNGVPNLQDTRSFTFTVTAVNDAPVLSAISNQTSTEDNAITVNFTITDVDNTLNCGTSLSATSSDGVLLPVGNIVFSGTAPNCTAVLTPALNQNGVSNIGFTLTDGALTSVQNFTATYTAVNDAPVLSAISNQTSTEDSAITVNFTITDVDNTLNCGTSMTASSSDTVVLPVGNIVFSGTAPNCTAVLTPALDQSGVSNVGFTLTDGALTSVQNFTATYTATNDAPVLSAISNQTVNEDNSVVVNFTITDVDNTLNCGTSMTASSSDTVVLPVGNIVFAGTAPNCTATLSPALDQNGNVNLTFRASDGALFQDQTFTLTVTPVNDAPVLSAIANQAILEGQTASINFTITDVDNTLNCGTSMSATSSNITLLPVGNIVFSGTAPNCTAVLTPAALQNGITNVSFTLTDGILTSIQSFSLSVSPQNDPPVLGALSAQTVAEDNTVSFNFTINDPDSSLVCDSSYVNVSSNNVALIDVAQITVSGTAPNCQLDLAPLLNRNGSAVITVTVSDLEMIPLTDTGSFTFTVTAVNDAPVLSAISNQTATEDNAITVNFTITDVDNTLNCGTSLTATSSDGVLLPVGNIVFSGTAPNCTAVLTPALNQNGVSNIGFTLTDGALTSVQNFTATYAAVNDAPVLSAISNQTSTEDSAITVNFTITDVDNTLNCGTSLSATSSDGVLLPVGNIVFSGMAPNCTAVLTPALDQSGVSNIGFTLTDGTLTSVQNFTATYTATNDAPVLSAISNQTVNEDNSVVVSFTITDVDNTLNCGTSMTASSSDTVVLPVGNIVFAGTAPNCTATLSPALDQNGNVNLTFRVSDGALFQDQTFTLTVTPVNDAPVLSAIAAQTTTEDNALVIPFTIADVDSLVLCTSANISVVSSSVTLVPNANIVIGGATPNCTLTVTPLADQNGVTNITVTLNDNETPNLQDAETFIFTVTPVNDAPALSAISNQTVNEDNSVVVNFTITDVDDALNCGTSMTASSSDTVVLPVGNIVFAGTAPNCTATLSPALDQNGNVNLTFRVSDGSLFQDQTFSLTVAPINDAPVLSTISNQLSNEDNAVVVNFTLSDVDNVLLCSSANLSVTSSNTTLLPLANAVIGGTLPNCTLTMTPVLNESGITTLVLTANDNGIPNLQDTKTFTYTVAAVNDAPVLSAISNQTVNEDNSVVVNFTITDVDDTLNCGTSMTASSSDTVVLPVGNIVFAGTAPNCTATLSPDLNQNGNVNLTFRVSDGTLFQDQTFTLTVTGINDAPVLSAITAQTTSEDNSLAVNFTITDVDNTLNCGTSMTASSSDTVVLPVGNIIFTGTAPNCTATLSPDLNQNGNVNLTFRVSDGTLFQDQTFALTVTPVNDAPTISAISDVTTTEDIATVVNFTINDVDNTLNCGTSLSATSSNVTLQPVANIVFTGTAPNCTATLTPAANQSGSSNISIIVTDGSLSTPEAFVLNVIATDDPPVMSAITNQTVSEDGTINVNFTVTDPDSTLACGSPDVFASSSNATLIPAATITFSGTIPNCTATLTPQPNRFGTSTITIVASDGTNLATRSFTLTVTSVNDAPVMSSLTNQTIKTDESAIANYTLTDVDHTMNCSTSVTVTSSNTAVLPTANIVKSGTAPNCILTITPSLNVAGSSTITVVGSDGTLTATQTMTLTLINVTGLAVSPTTLTLINAGSTSQIQAQATYSDASTSMVTTGVDMSWTSSSTAVATVNNAGSKGLVTAVANGNSNITATYKGLTAVTATSVVTMTGITVSQSVINSGIGSVVSVTSQAIYTPSGTQDITSLTTWTSSNSGVASVSQGVVTLNSAGTATITASYGGYSQTVSVNVQNKSLVSIAVTPASHSMGVNATRDFIATATYSDASTANVTTSATWSSTNTAVATISNTAPTIGRATGLAGGTTTITATIGAVSGNSSLTVTAATLSSIAITPDDALVTSNGSYQLRAIGTFSDASTSDITEQVTWSSSNTTAATISNTAGTRGLATTPTFTGYRTTTITATLGAVSDTTPLGVNGSTVTSILVTPTIQITAGSTYNLKAYANLADGGSIEVTDFAVWSSGSTSVATVSNGIGTKGLVSGVSTGTASISAVYGGQTGSRTVTVAATEVITEVGTGLLGQYYNWTGGAPPASPFLPANKKGERVDARINFAWGNGSAPMGVGDYFAVRWTGFYKAINATNYFCAYSDDGIRVYLNGSLIINNWTLHGPTWNCTANIPLTVGTKYTITYEYFENGGGSEAHLTRSSVSAADAQNTGTRAVPQVDLYPN